MPRYYPLFLDITDRVCLVVGGGSVGARKANELMEAGGRVRVVSPSATLELQALADRGRIELLTVPYESRHLDGCRLVCIATNNREVNARITVEAQARGLMVNVADAPETGDFIVPAVVRRGEFCLSISTGGANPLLAAQLRAEMEARFGPEYGDYVELLGRMRNYIKQATKEPTLRKAALTRLLESEALLCAHLRAGEQEQARAEAERLVTETLE